METKKEISITNALTFGWNSTINNLSLLVKVFWPYIAYMVIYLISFTFLIEPKSFLAELLKSLNTVISALFACDMMLFSLYLTDGKKEEATKMNFFSGLSYFITYMFTSLFYGLKVIFGFILMIIPGFIFMTQGAFAQLIAIDKKTSPFQALSQSKEITNGIKMQVFELLFIIVLLNMAGFMLFMLGSLITIPVGYFALTYTYRYLSPVSPIVAASPTPTNPVTPTQT